VNAYGAVVLAALLCETALEAAADALNLRAVDRPLPPEFRAVYDAERYARAQAYLRDRTRFALVVRAVELAVVLAFWLGGGFAWLDRGVRAAGLGPIPTGLAFFAALGLGWGLVELPFDWWATFVIEARWGFNRTSPRTFWTDRLKGAGLAVLLGGPLLAAVLWLFRSAGGQAWLWCWLVSAAFLAVVQLVAPTWIMPLFNRFTPLDTGEVRDAVLAYARRVGFPLEGLFVVDGSRRSSKANAFFTGFGRRRRLALFDTLLERHGPDEVVAVVAHEVGHWRLGHVWEGFGIAVVRMGIVFFLLSVLLDRPGLYAAFWVTEPSVHAGLVFFGFLFGPIDLLLGLLVRARQRDDERAADRFAAETTGTGAPLARALARLAADALENPAPHPLYVALHHAHPPVAERVRALAPAGSAS
jgi:STE24 endopeptidase